jgi:glycine cleavage system H lipoate-binding protein
MIALLIILTFVVAVLIDHLMTREPIHVTTEAPQPAYAQGKPRLVPAVVAGFALPDNLRYHPGHTWAVAESTDLVRVGIDDFASKLAGAVTTIDIPARGQWIRQGQRIISMHHDGREIDLVSPIEGTVVDVNQTALADPAVVKGDPYGEGWLLTVNSPDANTNFRNLLGGTLARRWMDDAATRLRTLALPAAATAQEGGLAVSNIIDELPEADWTKITKELFL